MEPFTPSEAPGVGMAQARAFAAKLFVAMRRDDLAGMVAEGEGDDFAEVQVAAQLFQERSDELERLRMALAEYAAPDFWDDSLPGGALALHDAGEMARNALAGRPPFFHRD